MTKVTLHIEKLSPAILTKMAQQAAEGKAKKAQQKQSNKGA